MERCTRSKRTSYCNTSRVKPNSHCHAIPESDALTRFGSSFTCFAWWLTLPHLPDLVVCNMEVLPYKYCHHHQQGLHAPLPPGPAHPYSPLQTQPVSVLCIQEAQKVTPSSIVRTVGCCRHCAPQCILSTIRINLARLSGLASSQGPKGHPKVGKKK